MTRDHPPEGPDDNSPDKPQSWTTSPPALRARHEHLTTLDTGEHSGVGDHVAVLVNTDGAESTALRRLPLGQIEPCAPACAGRVAGVSHDLVPYLMERR